MHRYEQRGLRMRAGIHVDGLFAHAHETALGNFNVRTEQQPRGGSDGLSTHVPTQGEGCSEASGG